MSTACSGFNKQLPFSELLSREMWRTQSSTVMKRNEASVSPYRTPLKTSNVSVSPSGVMTLGLVASTVEGFDSLDYLSLGYRREQVFRTRLCH